MLNDNRDKRPQKTNKFLETIGNALSEDQLANVSYRVGADRILIGG